MPGGEEPPDLPLDQHVRPESGFRFARGFTAELVTRIELSAWGASMSITPAIHEPNGPDCN
jgi:hypothetical protein